MTGTYYSYLIRTSSHCIHFLEQAEARASFENLRSMSEISTYSLDGANIKSDRDMLAALANELHFPEYFGMNLDALNDCMRDMDGQDAPGYALAVWNSTVLWRDAPQTAANMIHAWQFAVEETWLPQGKSLHLVFVW